MNKVDGVMKGKTLSTNIIKLIILTLGLKVVGFISRSVIAYYFGTTSGTDVYYTASGFIDSISAILLSGLTVGVVNIYIGHDKENRIDFISNLFCIISIVTAVVGIICIALATPFSTVLMVQGTEESSELLQTMLRVLCIAFPFQGMISVMGAVLQAEKDFTPVKITGTITSITNIICVVCLAKNIGISALMIAYVTGAFLNALFLYLNLRKIIKIRIQKIQYSEDIKRLLSLIVPLTIGMAAHQVNLIIDKSIASSIVVGAISALSYASFLYLFIENVIIQSVSTALFPEIVEEFQKTGDECRIANKVRMTSLLTLYVLVPIVVVCLSNDNFIIRILYMRGSFGEDSLALTTAALRGYVVGILLLSVRDIANRVYYTYGDTKTPVVIGVISVVINIVLDVILSRFLGVLGITLATSISNSISAILMIVCIKKYNNMIFNKHFLTELFVLVLVLIISVVCGRMIAAHINAWISVFAIVVISGCIELILAKMLHFPTYDTIESFLMKMRKGKETIANE